MKILHILRNPPDETIERLIDAMTGENDESTVEPIFKPDVNWDRLVDDIFANDKVICWW